MSAAEIVPHSSAAEPAAPAENRDAVAVEMLKAFDQASVSDAQEKNDIDGLTLQSPAVGGLEEAGAPTCLCSKCKLHKQVEGAAVAGPSFCCRACNSYENYNFQL